MKVKTVLFAAITLSLLIGGMGCEKENNITYPDAIILKELPKFYLSGNIKQGEQKMIQSKNELLSLFNQTEIGKMADLQNIDFSKQTLLIGCDSYPNEANFIYTFSKKTKKNLFFALRYQEMRHNLTAILIMELLFKNYLKQLL